VIGSVLRKAPRAGAATINATARGTKVLADTIIFALTALLVVTCALLVVLNRHPVHSALFLVLTFLGLAVFYLQLQAPFLAAVQVIVYAGAIMVLFVFVIMLIAEDEPLKSEHGLGVPPLLGAIFALGFIAELGYLLARRPAGVGLAPGDVQVIQSSADNAAPMMAPFGSAQAIGTTLFTNYAFAFEATSIVLLIAMIGVVVLAKKKL
jgi:NADH-quinone oxidoreductase subunit J